MRFKNRRQAGELLAQKLRAYENRSPTILAVPRGGVEVAYPIWKLLGGVLEVHITRKIGAPQNPELAIGALSPEGYLLLNEDLVRRLHVSREYIQESSRAAEEEIKRRLQRYRGQVPPPPLEGRLVILVDDGVATGFTLRAALRGLKQSRPERLVLAVPVGPPETLESLSREVDEIHYLSAPPWFEAVGQFYDDFSQVSDEEVMELLRRAANGEQE
ncbi:MAG TPA: phosphoribosyltransferase [Bacillota bacterium]|nr:phosphoribosyltransferase [Bacillota bacterium]HOB87527.1 phosphoribosyltransferase [Bacillota bacterium]HOP68184.1 phosphoribosyltransferase [Bacillota bacterium]HPT33054.1 phosphoribosyltransferase [Bacillota bacterium]HQD05242.1 phosphoribosyltransferase [Bacillota bacterium]